MKYLLPTIVLSLLLSFESPSAEEDKKQTSSIDHRYELIPVTLDTVTPGGTNLVPIRTVIKLDKVTGRTWKLVMANNKNGYYEGWIEVFVQPPTK